MKRNKISLACIVLSLFILFASCGTNVNKSDDSELSTECSHVDSNRDNYCDICKGSLIVKVDFYALNDLHGKIFDGESHPGVDELSTYLKMCQAQDDNSILLSSGDMWQGSSESNLTKGRIVTDWMNQVGFDAMTLGNHEFDWGGEYIEVNEQMAEFPFLAINIYDAETNQPVEYCQPSVMVDLGEIQVGIIGAIGDCHSSISGEYNQNFYFKVGDDLTELVKNESKQLREEGADFIVYSLHDGYSRSSGSQGLITDSQLSGYYDPELSSGGYVDLSFEGHTHAYYVKEDSYGVFHLQNGGDNAGISHVEIAINILTGKHHFTDTSFISTDVYDNLADDDVVDGLKEKYDDEISIAEVVLGTNAEYRPGNELRQLVAELYYTYGMEKWGDDYNIALGGGFISVRDPRYLPAGPVKYSQLQSLFPFDNKIVLCSIRGYDLKYKFFETSNTNYFIHYGEYGSKIKNSINFNETYYVVTDTYSSNYSYNNLTEIEYYDTNTFAKDFLARYITEGGLS